MFDFRMSTTENFASFRDSESDRVVFVDSHDNVEFNVRLGTVRESQSLGSVKAANDASLNQQLSELVAGCVI